MCRGQGVLLKKKGKQNRSLPAIVEWVQFGQTSSQIEGALRIMHPGHLGCWVVPDRQVQLKRTAGAVVPGRYLVQGTAGGPSSTDWHLGSTSTGSLHRPPGLSYVHGFQGFQGFQSNCEPGPLAVIQCCNLEELDLMFFPLSKLCDSCHFDPCRPPSQISKLLNSFVLMLGTWAVNMIHPLAHYWTPYCIQEYHRTLCLFHSLHSIKIGTESVQLHYPDTCPGLRQPQAGEQAPNTVS